MQERKYMAHYLDAAFDMSYESPNYYRIGKNLEEYNDELNPDMEVSDNVLGEQTVKHSGYEVEGDAEPYYYDYADDLGEKLTELANKRSTGDKCKTTVLDVLLKPNPTDSEGKPVCVWAYREDAYVIPTSFGGDTSGIQIPFSVYRAGNRVKGVFNIDSKRFYPNGEDEEDPVGVAVVGKVKVSWAGRR